MSEPTGSLLSGPAAERRAEFVAVADRLAGRFAERAASHDEDASFPHENYADLADAGMLRLSVPEELGGLGAGLGDVVAVLERLAMGDGATALAVTMHISPLGQWGNVWRRTGAPRLAHLLRRAAGGRWCGLPVLQRLVDVVGGPPTPRTCRSSACGATSRPVRSCRWATSPPVA